MDLRAAQAGEVSWLRRLRGTWGYCVKPAEKGQEKPANVEAPGPSWEVVWDLESPKMRAEDIALQN